MDKIDRATNRPKPLKMAFKPSFLDRLPPLNEEWEEALNHANNGNGGNGEDQEDHADAGGEEDHGNVED